MDKPDGYFTISEMAKALDVKKSHIRFCEENGLISPRTTQLKRRVYNRYDRERLKLIFRFVLQGYSKEQIIGLIGIPDANLDENDQLTQGIRYGEAKIEVLEKHKDELSFTKQTRIMNEIEMLREYIINIRAINTGDVEKPSKKPGIEFEEKANRSREPRREIGGAEAGKPKQHPVTVISVFIAGLVLVILIGSYFYYRTGKEETKTVKPVQKKAIPKDLVNKEVPVAAGEDRLPAVVPEPGQIQDIEIKPSPAEPEKEQPVSKDNIDKQENRLNRLKSFLRDYCQAYTNKDLNKFVTFFASDATQNDRPFFELLPDYRKRMEDAESLTCRIELVSYTQPSDGGIITMHGNFFTGWRIKGGDWKEKNSGILMELLENQDSFLVKHLEVD
jgi:DNA-binding transcriptional MerR regulator